MTRYSINDSGSALMLVRDDAPYPGSVEVETEHHRHRARHLHYLSSAKLIDPRVGQLLAERLWLDITGDGVDYQQYTRRVQADTAAPNPRVPVTIFKRDGCSCCPGGRHPAGTVLSPVPLSTDNTVVWDNGTDRGIEHNVPFRFVHYEAPPFDITPGQTRAYVHDAGIYAIEGWDRLPYQKLKSHEVGASGEPVFAQWERSQPCDVWFYQPDLVIHFHRVERVAGSLLKVGDQMGLIYSREPRQVEPQDLYDRLAA